MATIGLVPLILMLITRTASISLAQVPTHPTTPLVGTASLCIHVVSQITRSGGVYLDAGTARSIGSNIRNWLNVAYANINAAYYLDSDPTSTFTALHYVRWRGYAVRCILFYP